ncbi:MAG: exodeoxyribonuclease V subunit alpha [Desulfobacter sp.]|nr:MAG: exodeoxyribonuclease V subunit alpha [Desulfobacter sp.]
MIEVDALTELIRTWTARGWLRPLDRAFAGFLHRQEPGACALVLMAAALASHQLGRGHICLDIEVALADPDGTLSLPPEGETGEQMPPKPSQILAGVTRRQWVRALEDSALVGKDGDAAPLVLNRDRLYLRRFWGYTRQVSEAVLARICNRLPLPDDMAGRLDRLFSGLRTKAEKEKAEIHWQTIAAAVAASSTFCVISGGPGTGKTTTVVQILALLQSMALEEMRPLRIRLAAPTGKAAARLTESMGAALDRLPADIRGQMTSEVSTLHRLLGARPDSRHFIHNRENPLHLDLLVVDEASMIDLEMMDALLGALPRGARLILLGDKDQLASVEAGSVLGDICATAGKPGYRKETTALVKKATGYDISGFSGPGTGLDQHIVLLRKSHRFHDDSGIGALARAVNRGDETGVDRTWEKGFEDISKLAMPSSGAAVFSRLVLDGNPGAFASQSPGPAGYRAYLDTMAKGPAGFDSQTDWLNAVLDQFNRFRLLTPLRKGEFGVDGLNRATADILFEAGGIPAVRGWYPGRPVMVTRNDYSLGLMNGDIGIALEVKDERYPGARVLRVVFPTAGSEPKLVLPSRLEAVETVFAMTVHKSQGSEFDHTALVLPGSMGPVMTRELVYTGITRARSFFTLAGPNPEILSRAVAQRTHRASGLGDLLRAGAPAPQ